MSARRGARRNEPAFWFEVKDILAMEMVLLEHMAFYLGVFHPYRDLSTLLAGRGSHGCSCTNRL